MNHSPAAPRLSDLFASAALRRLPKTRAPLCGCGGGLYAPNAGRKSSLKEPFFFSPRKVVLLLPRAALKLLYTSVMPGSLMCPRDPPAATAPRSHHSSTKLLARSHRPNGQPKAAKMLPQAGAWPRSLSSCQMKVFSRLLLALCFGDRSSINLLCIHFQGQVSTLV